MSPAVSTVLLFLGLSLLPRLLLAAPGLDPTSIGAASGAKPTVTPDGVVKLGWPRDDVPVRVDGVSLKPFAGLGSWAAFTPAPNGAAMMMGDTVVFQDEVNPAIDAAFAHGLEVTALHNHFFYSEPAVFFMHIGGHGEPKVLAAGVKAVWEAIKTVRKARPAPVSGFGGPDVKPGAIAAEPLEKVIGVRPEAKDGVVKFTIARDGMMHGLKVGGAMGLTTWAAFSGTDEAAAVDGDFIMGASEVQPVLKALRAGKVHIVALHNHMIGESPAVFFTHFWAKGRAVDLANVVKAALSVQRAAGKARQ